VTQPGAAAKRDYGGQTARARIEARRAKLIDAGLELFGTVGYRGTSVRGVLRESGVGERYFYESFDTLEDLLIAVAEEVQRQVKDAVLGALAGLEDPTIIDMCRAGLLALAAALTDDPRCLRVAMVESIGVSERVTSSRSALIDWFVELVVASTVENGPIPPASARIFALALVGATNEVLMRWAAGAVPLDMPTVVEHLLILFWGTFEYAEALCVVAEP
jgi:AcrR family transcriptional regulator